MPSTMKDDYRHASATRTQIATEQTYTALTPEQEAPAAWRSETSGDAAGRRRLPHLVWKRSDETRDGCYEPVGQPLYEHERIEPAVWLQSLAKQRSASGAARSDRSAHQLGMDLGPRYDPESMAEENAFRAYRQGRSWMNRLIRGSSTDVMASLLAKERMAGQVQAVYMDPPYGIDFNRVLPLRTGKADDQKADDGQVGVRQTASVRCFTDRYRDGLHSYLDTLYREFILVRDLLTDHGSLFVQIGRAHVHRLALLLDEVFGEENRVTTIVFSKGTHTSRATLAENGDFILWYCKEKAAFEKDGFVKLYSPVTRKEIIEKFNWDVMVHASDGRFRRITDAEREDPDRIPVGDRVCRRMPLSSQGESTTGRSAAYTWTRTDGQSETVSPPPGTHWPVSMEGLDRLNALGRLTRGLGDDGLLGWVKYEDEYAGPEISNLWEDLGSPTDLHYVVETAPAVIERCLLMTTKPGDLVLDPTGGSGTTALVAERWGRRWISIDGSAVAVAVARQRLLTAVHPWHLLIDEPEGDLKERQLRNDRELGDQAPLPERTAFGHDPQLGFVYKRIKKVSASILAYDRKVETTLLVDQTYRRGKRVTSAFTVESHNPYRIASPREVAEATEGAASPAPSEHNADVLGKLAEMLERNGIRDMDDRRTEVTGVTDWPVRDNRVLTHAGWSGRGRCAIALFEPGVTADQATIKCAVTEALRSPEDVRTVVIAAFAFGPEVRQAVGTHGNVDVRLVQTNQELQLRHIDPDRAMRAFVEVGEPDVAVIRNPDDPDEVFLQVRGFDCYDPATGSVRRGEKRNIACWMVDTEHNDRAFCARLIGFPNRSDDKQLQRMKRELASRIDPERWKDMTSDTSLPFRWPKHANVAVRIITEYGDEMTTIVRR